MFIIQLFLMAGIAFAEPGDELIVKGNIVNLRAGPSTDHEVVLRLEQGRSLYLVQHEEEWMQVRTGPEEGMTGWIHSSLVKKAVRNVADKKPDREERLESAFGKFKPLFDAVSKRIEVETGNVPFIQADYTGNGVVKLTASETWLNSTRMQREKHLAEIFELWDAKVEVGLPVSIDIVNPDDERLMVMFR